jgi:hypothetical protein
MSNQEPQNPDKMTEEAEVENRRRFIKGAGAAVPVILTLASPSVFGLADGQACYSQQLSGVLRPSQVGFCSKGYPPSFWKIPRNVAFTSDPLLNSGKWWGKIPVPPLAGSNVYKFGKSLDTVPNQTACGRYDNTGTKFNDTALGFGGANSLSMRQLICGGTDTNPSEGGAFVAALFNSLYVPNYILPYEDVIKLYLGTKAVPPGYGSKKAFLISTW